jgi:carboxymethylenebutenolidase
MALREYLIEEVALDCAEGLLSRRDAIRRLGLLGVGGAAAAAMIAAVPSSVAARASSTEPPEPDGSTAPLAPGEDITFTGTSGDLIGVFSAADQALGSVLVIHENRGLTPHIRTIPPRLAADGFSALAIDLISAEGGTASMPTEDEAMAALGAAPEERLIADLRSGLNELERRVPDTKLAAIGFCFGGGMTWRLLAAGEPRLAAAVPFYGPLPDGADLSGSPSAAVLGIYAELDSRVNGTRDAAEEALTAAGLVHELRTFEGVDHAFFNDTGQRYNAEAAAAAYQAMLDWFAEHLAP